MHLYWMVGGEKLNPWNAAFGFLALKCLERRQSHGVWNSVTALPYLIDTYFMKTPQLQMTQHVCSPSEILEHKTPKYQMTKQFFIIYHLCDDKLTLK